MGTEIFLVAVGLLLAFAVLDLIVGVGNDAVNFLNSALGSRVAPRYVILIIASLGILAGVMFSSGMMEVARKGIFQPQLFTMPELITIFLAVMLTDIVLLDLFNSFGLPTSTTVSIVFELLGAAVAVSLLKIAALTDGSLLDLADYINTSKALAIIAGILLSVAVAFIFGALVQFLTRLVFTFDHARSMKRYGAIWSGIAMASITFFIMVKGAKGASFITSETAAWIKEHGWGIMGATFAVSTVIFAVLQSKGVNILKPVILVGTFALALAFAANDLVNFIGVPVAGLHAYGAAVATPEPLTANMGALAGKVPSSTWLLLVAGAVMVMTLWLSRKARTVTETEIRLGQQEEGMERFESTTLSRTVVRMAISLGDLLKAVMPRTCRKVLTARLDPVHYESHTDQEARPSFDLLRASVNLMVASAVVSYATSRKLPLSTTYVTFMVAMGTSFADQAWGRESAVYRVTGVLTVVGGWFLTALLAFTVSGVFATAIFFGQAYGAVALLLLVGLLVIRSQRLHRERRQASQRQDVFNLTKVSDYRQAVRTTFQQMGLLVREIRESVGRSLEALFTNNPYQLRKEKGKAKAVQSWTNIICANVFKSMRLLQIEGDDDCHKYAQTIRRMQKLADGHWDLVNRAFEHTRNYHMGLLPEQVEDLRLVRQCLNEILLETEGVLASTGPVDSETVMAKNKELGALAERLNQVQIDRIRDQTSKTRLSVLFYAIVGNAMMLAKQNLKLLEIFDESFGQVMEEEAFDLD